MMAFINLFNEWHPKETSKKSRVAAKIRAERGERLACRPPYGYRKPEENSKLIVPDEESSLVVKRIFDLCAGGMGPSQIGKPLKKEGVVNPTVYTYRKFGYTYKGHDTDDPYEWSSNTVARILDNEAYLGRTLNLRSTTASYKDKRKIRRPESEWLRFKGTHEPLISQDVWDIVQGVRQHKRRQTNMDEQNMFSGLVFCADCGKVMTLHRAHTIKEAQYHFKCSLYSKKGKDACTAHYIWQSQIEAIILEDLRRTLWFAASREREFAEIISRKNTAETRREIKKRRTELDAMRRRDSELNNISQRLYEDICCKGWMSKHPLL